MTHDDTAEISPLVTQIAALIHRVCIYDGPGDWAENAAVLIVNTPHIGDGLTALDQRDAVLDLHTPRKWGDNSPTVVCSHCLKGWPCPTAELLGVAA